MSDSDNDSMMNESMDDYDMDGEQSSTAIVLAGMELTAGAEPQPLTPAGELPPSAVVTLTRATLVMQKPIPANTMLYLRSHINEEQTIVLTVLSLAHPTSALDLCFHADSVPEFSVEAVNGDVASTVSVHISGYVEVSGDADEDDEDDDDEEVDMEKLLAGLKDEEDDSEEEAVNQKKGKAPIDEEIDSDEADEPVLPVKPAAKAQKQPQSQSQKKEAAPAAPQTVKLGSGLQYTDEVVGNGVEAKSGKSVQIRYKGELMSGKVFDTNMPKGKPFAFKLGAGECIPGFDAGIKGMKVGGRRVLVIPPQLGYGKKGSPPQIPGNATLKFTVELLKA